MLDTIIKGISLGIVVAIMVGPVFFFILNTSIKRGFIHAVYTAIGVMLSDAFFISLAYFGSSVILYLDRHENAAGIVGGIVIMIFGCYLIFSEAKIKGESLVMDENPHPFWVFIAKGFMLNSVNPSVLLFWIVVASTVPAKEQFTSSETLMFYACTLGTILGTDFLKAYLASRLKKIINHHFLIWLNRIAGSVLAIYGGSMIVRVILEMVK